MTIFIYFQKQEEWKIVFWITFIVYVVTVVLYCIMCSGTKQSWAGGQPVRVELPGEEEEKEKEDKGKIE